MDFSPILQQTMQALWYFIPLVIVAGVIKSPRFKGWGGECLVNLSARLFLDRKTYHLIRNVTLPIGDGSTQIDHIIVSPFGVFVVETKNMTGWIFGGARQKVWTQTIYRHSSKFQNPLHQNYKHVMALKAMLGLTDAQIHSVVVFVGDATFKTNMPANVTQGGGYLRFIKSYTEPVLSQEEVLRTIDDICSGRFKASLRTSRKHVRYVRKTVREKRSGNDLYANKEDRLVFSVVPDSKR